MANFKLSPSDFGFLWTECKRCFYLKVARGFPRPDTGFPRVFNTIDKQMKGFFAGKRSEDMAPGVPPGAVHASDERVESVPIARPGHSATVFIRGIFDTVLKLDEGGYAVIDFKTSTVDYRQAAKYGRQLHAYAIALERPAAGRMGLNPVTTLGLLVYEPTAFVTGGAGTARLDGKFEWLEVERDDNAFLGFLDEMLGVLELPEPPPAGPECALCNYRQAGRRTGW